MIIKDVSHKFVNDAYDYSHLKCMFKASAFACIRMNLKKQDHSANIYILMFNFCTKLPYTHCATAQT